MYRVQQISTEAQQQQTIVLPDGTSLSVSLYFSSQQQGWFITNLTYGSFSLNGLRITVNPNILRQYKNQIPFGLACYYTTSQREPTQLQDFYSGLFQLFILTAEEVQQYESYIG